MPRFVLILLSALALIGSPASAKDMKSAVWIVTQLSGDARVARGGLQPVALGANARLRPGDTIITGASGRATLARGPDYIIIAPRSELRLPSTPTPNGFTRVMQRLGTMLFKVQHTGVPHFAVDTPMLAAVVKGTTFTVIVDQNRSAVQVTQGAVEVTAVDGGMKRLVEGGRTVFISHAKPMELIDAGADAPAPATDSSDNSVKIIGSSHPSVASIASVTGGLVRPVVAPQPIASFAQSTSTTVGEGAAPGPTTAPVTTEAPGTATVGTAPAVTATPVGPAPPVPTTPVTAPVLSAPTVTTPGAGTPTLGSPTLTVPSVTPPTVNVPAPSVPTITVPSITTPTPAAPIPSAPTITVPTITVPTVTTPTIPNPTVTAPTLTAPTPTMPSAPTPAAPSPTIPMPTVTSPPPAIPSLPAPVGPTPTIPAPTITVPTVPAPTAPVPTVPKPCC